MTPTAAVILLLGITAVIYAGTSVAYIFAARPGMVITFVGYVIANAGLIWDAFSVGKNCGP